MTEQHVDEWSRLTSRAIAAIKSGAGIRERGMQRQFQLVVIPAFDVVASWELFEKYVRSGPNLFEIALLEWDQPVDASKLESPLKYPDNLEPTIRLKRTSLDGKRASSMLAVLSGVQVPLLPGDHPIGCDGTTYRITVGDLFSSSTFEWWESGPERWTALASAVRDIHTMVVAAAPPNR